MMAISRSIQFDGSFKRIHFCFIQFLCLYIHILESSCCEVGFGQYHMILMDLPISETFFIALILSKKNRMLDSLSLVLLFIATNCPTFNSLNGSNSGNGSSWFTFVKTSTSLVISHCFLASLEVILCSFRCFGPKYPLSSISER